METSNLALHEAEACTGKLSADVKVKAQGTADINVILDFKIEFARCPPAANFNVFGFIFTDRNGRIRKIRNR